LSLMLFWAHMLRGMPHRRRSFITIGCLLQAHGGFGGCCHTRTGLQLR